jgi:hypothetical protein
MLGLSASGLWAKQYGELIESIAVTIDKKLKRVCVIINLVRVVRSGNNYALCTNTKILFKLG